MRGIFKRLLEQVRSGVLLAQLVRFAVVGGIAAVIDWGVLAICVRILGIDSIVSNVIAFLVSVPCNYWMSVRFVFDVDRGSDRRRLFWEFMILAAAGLGINELIMWVGDKLLSLDPLLVKVAGIAVAGVFNFITRKLVLEKRREKRDEKRPVAGR